MVDMNTIIPDKQWKFMLRVLFLLVVFIVLLISFFSFPKSDGTMLQPVGDFRGYAQFYYFTLPQLLGWIFLFTAIVFFLFDQKRQQIRSFPIIFGLTAVFISTSYYSTFPSNFIKQIWLLSVLMVSISFLFHFLSKLMNRTLAQQIKKLFLILSGFIVIGYVILSISSEQATPVIPDGVIMAWSGLILGLALLSGLILVLKNRKAGGELHDAVTAIGFILSWLPVNVLLFQKAFQPGSPITPWIFLPIALYPICIGGVIKLEEMGTEKSTGLSNSKGINGILLLYGSVGLIILIASWINRSSAQNFLNPPLYVGLILLLLAIVFVFLMAEKLEPTCSVRDTPSQNDGNTISLIGKNSYVPQGKPEEVVEELRMKIINLPKVKQYHHFVFEASQNHYRTFEFRSGKTSDLHFSSDSALVHYLVKTKTPLIINDFESLIAELFVEREKLELLGADLIIPIIPESHLEGWLAIAIENPKPDEFENFISKINPLQDQFSNFIKSMHHQKDMEQRLSDIEVLTRIVQGVNYTLLLDDIYELIYAQTTQVIPVDDFSIVLKDHQTNRLRYVFLVELDERITQQENKLVTQNQSIEARVIESGVGLILNNFAEDCKKENFPIINSKIETAMIVPLNTGALTNGCIIMAQRAAGKHFTQTQLRLSQSIADLVAGAIEKARLLEETEQYARQLAILNDLTRKLTSTLEIEEVYRTILQNSVDMVNCEEARLIIAEEKTQQFVFEAVIGNKSHERNQRRVPLDFGLIGKSYLDKNQILVNSNSADQQMMDEIKKYYGIPISAVMIIPMISKNQVLGLIELVKRVDESGFTSNDQEIISALAAQAAIALENARLYRRTDQELAKRVEELSVMQRIDRELNASLDMKKATELTLAWAIRQSGCGAGWIGLISDSTLTRMASSGYSEDQLIKIDEKTINLNSWVTEKGNERIDPVQIEVNDSNQLHPLATSQILLPIRREDKIIALMILENFDDRKLDPNELNFLVRLCEHASIAIVNSQLYAQVQEANQAKSDFVSLVAHELKNPMTSIKGYTELLATGAVGAITPAQGNFLTTIRNNTDRMNTLVSDLNDLTKIEAGSMRMEPKALDLHEIVNEVVRSTKKQLDEKQQILNLIMEERLPNVWADPNRLLQILINLVSNAHKYTPTSGEIAIIAERSNEDGGVDPFGNFIHLQVSDNGFGISEKDQQMIFQKFFRSEDDDVRVSTGTGLGLNITRSLVEMQGGKIWFESEYRKGTIFHLTIPVAR